MTKFNIAMQFEKLNLLNYSSHSRFKGLNLIFKISFMLSFLFKTKVEVYTFLKFLICANYIFSDCSVNVK